MAERVLCFLPVVLAIITSLVVAGFVRQHQPDYSVELVTLQIVMVAAAFLVTAPSRWLRLVAFLGWILAMRLGDHATPSFLDTKPQKGCDLH